MPEFPPIYRWSLMDAVEHNEMREWRDSYRENCACARAIEKAINDHYHDDRLDRCVDRIISQYGFDRTNYVLANTIMQKEDDGRFSDDNKKWARKIHIPKDEVRWHFCVESHPGLTNLFVDQMREAWRSLGLFDHTNCISEKDGEIDYRGKVLVLDPKVLKEQSRTPANQLFLAEGGFGCSANSRGRKVFGRFLNDGEKTHFGREDFLGAIKDEDLPEWASQKLDEIRSAVTDESEGISMGGIV